ncbi:MAG: hypothetical protein M1453_14985 [Acidobacteria bacterium]|nr:hypothetical protein [Acidobacteriota bacterium]MCL5289286.1 hypothetical protein [Acidobacteriota bacterium]
MNHLNEEQLILYHYGEEAYREAAERRAASEHLAACDNCRASYAALQRVLAAVDAAPVPERAEEYGSEVWARLRPRLEGAPGKESLRGWNWWLAPQRWALAGAMAVLLIVAFFVGRVTREEPPTSAAISPQARERILMVAVGEHLERSQMVLVELSNAPSNGKVDISSEQHMASELVGENRLYRQTAMNAGEAGVASVLDELERVLVEVANSPSEVSSKQMESLRKRIESQGILFKVRVIGSEVRERAKPAQQDAAPQPAAEPAKKST